MARTSFNPPSRTILGVSLLVLAAVILILLGRSHWNHAEDSARAAGPANAPALGMPTPALTQEQEPPAALDRRLGTAPLVDPTFEAGGAAATPIMPPPVASPAVGETGKDDGTGVYLGGVDDPPM